jgi:hypothetical protein
VSRLVRRRGVPFLAAAVATLAIVPSAHAGMLVASVPDCAAQSLSQPFVAWLDPASYVLAPGGAFEASDQEWSLAGEASAQLGNEPWNVGSADDRRSLALPAGSAATSPTMCVGIGHPDLRVFTRRTGGTALSTLRVDVQFEDLAGDVQTLTIGHVAGGSWALSEQIPVVANLLPLLPGDMTPVRFSFTPEDGASWAIDDVYVDPWKGG